MTDIPPDWPPPRPDPERGEPSEPWALDENEEGDADDATPDP